jgi:hypothetical protein
MTPLGITLIGVAAVASYIYIGKPIVHVVKKADHAVCHVVTLEHKCKSHPTTLNEHKKL